MNKAIKMGQKRASTQMNGLNAASTALDLHGNDSVGTIDANGMQRTVPSSTKGKACKLYMKTHFKGAKSLLQQSTASTKIQQTEDDIEAVMGIIQNQLMSEHGEGMDKGRQACAARFRAFIGQDVELNPLSLT
jgi:hypothetical protein